MNTDLRARTDDPFLKNYSDTDLRVAGEFLTNWLPFLSRDLCNRCSQTISNRIQSLHSGTRVVDDIEDSLPNQEDNLAVCVPACMDLNEKNQELGDTISPGSSKDGADVNDFSDTDSMQASETVGSPSDGGHDRTPHSVRMSWADMAQEGETEKEVASDVDFDCSTPVAVAVEAKVVKKPDLTREQREYIRFCNVKRKKDFECVERIKGEDVNIVEGLELHTSVFSAAEQKRIVEYVEKLQEMGKNGKLKARTYTAPQKWMRGKGRVTIQFGCCYNYAIDKNGNPPGIHQTELVDPIPPLLKVMIKRLIAWHVLPPSCVPDSCIINIYDEEDCIPPHIDSHDFVRPFCTVSFLSECNIVFGSSLKIVGPGEFSGPLSVPLPVGSVLVLNGNGADVAKHAVPAVPTKRISITFRKMDKLKRPFGFVLERDLQEIQPLPYGAEGPQRQSPNLEEDPVNKEEPRRGNNSRDRGRKLLGRDKNYVDQRGFSGRRRVRVDLGH